MQDRDWITRYLAREMYITAFNIDESDRVFAQTDPEVAKAVDAMPKANALLESTKKIIVERMNAQQRGSPVVKSFQHQLSATPVYLKADR